MVVMPDPKRLGRWFARSAAGVLLVAWASSARAGPAEDYAITIDGSPAEMEVVPIETGSTTDAVAVAINGLYLEPRCLVVGPPGRYSFTFEGDEGSPPTHGYLTRPGDKRRLVWLRIGQREDHGRIVIEDPLRGLSRTALKDLRGVFIEGWSKAVAAEIARLDLTRVCISTDTRPPVAELPAGVRYLAISPAYHRDLSGLRRFQELVFLTLNTHEAPFDAAWVATLANLQYLRMAVGGLENADRLKALHFIRRLTLRAPKGIEKLEFLPAMPALQKLSVHGPVDLGPVRELANLVELDASASPSSRLPPAKLPALRKVNVMSTKVSDAEVERFRALNPSAVVLHRWTSLLRPRLVGSSEVELEIVPTRRGDPHRSITVHDAADIAKLVAALEIDDPPRFYYGCLATRRLTFKRAGGPPAGEVIELVEGTSVRWGGFPGDAPLTPAGLRETRAWMARHGMEWTDCK